MNLETIGRSGFDDRGGETAVLEPPVELAPRVIGRFGARQSAAATLVCIGGLHGNEPAGVGGLQRVFQTLALRSATGWRGEIIGLSGNRKALAQGRRFLDEDLNRIWQRERLVRVRQEGDQLLGAEEEELQQLDQLLRQLLVGRDPRRVFVLDLHTTSGGGPAFSVLEDRLPNRQFALQFPVPLVLGLEEQVTGTLAHQLSEQGAVAIGFESGQHEDPGSVDRAEAAIWIGIGASGILSRGDEAWREVERQRAILEAETDSLPHVVEIRHRHAIRAGDRFEMVPGFVSFQRVERGRMLATDHRGEIRAPSDGLLLMPLYQRQGEDGFFVVQPVRPVWLKLSATLRGLHLERFLHWLPGVRRHPERLGSFLVDTRVARWLALEIFHLLGFRRCGEPGRYLEMTRRTHDR